MSNGKLYRVTDNELVTGVSYHFHSEAPNNWWGELTLDDYMRLDESNHYVIELEDARRGKCRLRKRVNRAVLGVPPRYIYQFTGLSPLE